jgi:hypothetical protein
MNDDPEEIINKIMDSMIEFEKNIIKKCSDF